MTEWFLVPFIQEYNLLYLTWKWNGMLLQSCCLMSWKVFQEIKYTGVDFLSLPYFESLTNFKWTTCNTIKSSLYTRWCFMMSGAIISIMLIDYHGVDPEILNFRTCVSPSNVQIYPWFDFEFSEEARKITLCSEYLLLGVARQGHT